ncbi:helix-turn-helix transcriptional regulator [Winogradskyella jejuensis]|uniref:Transcriptional regulator, AraC family n=1 Tax=Winogradskyella jejuensis TaxID=1089305 RepID=A0A1M5TAJ6_9FLAO|nr:helix-turn-helix domain-containing protein [Winogradskyella jejuensis]SHH47731.1 transcriptional regulator, AraC family [Winogradskyella jejuensis]
MEISKIFIIILLSLGAIQGIIYGIILFRSTSQNKLANRILSIILFILSYRLIVQVMRLFGIGYYDAWYYAMIDISWIHGALLYFYTKAHLYSKFKFKTKDLWHFIPVALQIIFSIFVRLQNLYWDGTKESLSWLGYYGYVVWMNNPTIYIVASILIIIYTYKALQLLKSGREKSLIQDKRQSWIRRIIRSFLIYFSFVLIVLLADLIAFSAANEDSYFYFIRFYYYPFFIGLAVLTYWIGLEGFARRNEKEEAKKNPISKEDFDKLKRISEQVEEVMRNQKLYKDPELSLNSLGKTLDIKPYLISRSVSEVFDVRFNDYINKYRVNEVQELLKDEENFKYTLLSLALEAGFNSKSSFNRAIKKHLGILPSDLKSN